MKSPLAKKIPFEIKQHGQARVDNYAWLRDKNWQKFLRGDLDFSDADVKAYIEEQNRHTEETMKDTLDLQEELYQTMLSRTKEEDVRPPRKHGEWLYYSRIEKGKNYKYHCRKKNIQGAAEEIYLDENSEAQGKGFYAVRARIPSKGDKYLLLSDNSTGSMVCDVRVKNLDSGAFLPWKIENATGSVCWSGDFEHIYFVERHPGNGRGQKIFRMNIHHGPESKELVFEKPESRSNLFMGIRSSANHDYLFINLMDPNANEVYFLEGNNPKAEAEIFWEMRANTIVSPDFAQGNFYILSNEGGKVNNQIFICGEDGAERENWRLLIESDEKRFIKNVDIYKDHMVLESVNNELALPELSVRRLSDGQTYNVECQDQAFCLGLIGAMEFDSSSIQYSYQSPVRPEEILELELSSGKTKVLKEGECPNYNPENYKVERLFVDAHDGAKIPLTVVSRKDFVKNGNSPHFQYGYGSYGISMPAGFSTNTFSLLDKGFSFSIAHIRGGSDKGYQWYLDGKMDKKMNTFRDFISCSNFLIEQGYASKGGITANGGSAGGLLMGAVSNMAPELYNSVILDVPFVDVINTISDDSLPLTPPEWNEWGNPIKDKKAFDYMMSYSPYDNVKAQSYPHMLFNTGITDEQVTYWEPAKMTAKLRELKTNDNMLLLKVKMSAGHAGSSARYKALREKAFSFAFALKAQGLS